MPRSVPRQNKSIAVPSPFAGSQHMSPGDEAPAGTPGTGQNVCRVCLGSGRRDDGQDCPNCEGLGYVITGIGGA